MGRTILVAAALLAAATARGQAPAPQPAQSPEAQPPPAAGSQGQAPATAGSQGQSSTAQPGSPGASSQQVVVNPPSEGRQQQPAPSTSTTVVNPPPYRDDTIVIAERERPSPFATVAMDAAWGGLAGFLVGFGVTLVDEFDDWQRDLSIGAGVGVIVGAAVGVAHAAYDAREADRRRRVAYRDGLGRTDRDPVVTAPTMGVAFRF